ncbi:MAG TPA: type II secretion system F family protein, partial [Beijerinckiaceae bacterium]
MFTYVISKLNDPQAMLSFFVALATMATIYSIALPFLQNDQLTERMKAVSTERSKIRARERERLQKEKTSLRGRESTGFAKQIVDSLKLSRFLGTDTSKVLLTQAGLRSPASETMFLFFRLVSPIGLGLLTAFYVFVMMGSAHGVVVKFGIVLAAALFGIKLPEIYLKNIIAKRQLSMRRAFPDALDLLLICVESGMSIEHAFRKVSGEVGVQSVPLAEELALTTAELSYLPERRTAYENLYQRTGLDNIRQITTVLVQAERYGTPVGQALRVVAQESRDTRMMEAEKKAAAL